MMRFRYEIPESRWVAPKLPFVIHTEMIHLEENTINWHANLEILCCVDGTGHIIVNSNTIPIRKGDCILINTNSLHAVINENNVKLHCLIIDSKFLMDNGIDPQNITFQERITDPDIWSSFLQIIQYYDAFLTQSDSFAVAKIRFHVIMIMLLIIEKGYYVPGQAENSTTNENIKTAIRYIQQNLTRPMSLQEIADHVGYSKHYLVREFKRITGTTVFSLINHLRCKEATHMMRQGMRVSEAAAACGFENMSYFTKTYKRYIGTLPKEAAKHQ